MSKTLSTRATPARSDTSPLSKLGEYTHIRNSEAVLVKSWARHGTDAFTVTTRWPDIQRGRPYDPRLLAQTVRQSGLVVAHAEYQVPTSYQTLLRSLNFTIKPNFRVLGDPEFLVDITVARTRGRPSGSLAMDFRITHEDTVVCRADTEFGWISPASYQRVRGKHLTVDWGKWPLSKPLAPSLVGRETEDDVLLAPDGAGHRWQLRNDVSNTLLFDHPVDHVPGLVLLDAGQQAAHAALTPTPFATSRIEAVYSRYVELDTPCLLYVERIATPAPGLVTVDVVGHQNRHRSFCIRLSGECD